MGNYSITCIEGKWYIMISYNDSIVLKVGIMDIETVHVKRDNLIFTFWHSGVHFGTAYEKTKFEFPVNEDVADEVVEMIGAMQCIVARAQFEKQGKTK